MDLTDLKSFLVHDQACGEILSELILYCGVVEGGSNDRGELLTFDFIAHFEWVSPFILRIKNFNRCLGVVQGNLMFLHFRIERANVDIALCQVDSLSLGRHFLLELDSFLEIANGNFSFAFLLVKYT